MRPGLLRADEPEIHVRQKLAVEQRSVLRSRRIVDPIAAAQRVEIVGAAGMLAAGERQRIGDALHADRRRKPEPAELVIEKAHVERRRCG